jgi:hypothetical protein
MAEHASKIQDEFHGARLRILGTNLDEPEEGRIFVWTKTGWLERIEGPSGDVAFTPIAESEDELHEIITRDDPSAELYTLGREYRKMVSEEFVAQSEDYADSPEYSVEEQTEDDDQQYHQHDLEPHT